MIIEQKYNEESNIIKPEPTVESKLEIYKDMIEIKSRIKSDVTADYVFCRLSDKDKEFVIEMVSNAYYGKKMLGVVKELSSTQWIYIENEWLRVRRTQEEINLLEKFEINIFHAFLIKVEMIAILNRNVKNNFLIRILSGLPETEPEDVQDMALDKSEGFLSKLRPKKKKVIDEDQL